VFNRRNIVFKGIAVSPGIAIGKVFLVESDDLHLIQKKVPISARKLEKKRLSDAVEKTRFEFEVAYNKINDALGRSYAQIASVHLLILDDPAMKKEVNELIDDGINAEYALFKVMTRIVSSFETIENDYFKERKLDIQDVWKKILSNLSGKEKKSVAILNKNSIVIAHNLTPTDTVSMRESLVRGFATDIGGKTSHTAIIAQGLEIPAVVGLKVISKNTKSGDIVIVDGDKGEVILNPVPEIVAEYKKKNNMQFVKIKELEKLKNFPARTIDDHEVSIYANIDNSDEIQSVLQNGATGIGLYRTEYIYINRNAMPSEEDHFEKYSHVVKRMFPYPTVIRTMDLGGDRLTRIGLLNTKREENPFLGLRAIRLCLKYPKIFVDQLRGVLRASAYGKIKLMYPMISGLGELHEAGKILEKVKQDLRREQIEFDENIEIGTMIEVPSAAMIIDAIVKEVDFVSIGTNDLIQYSLAIDRVNENVASLYDPLHPAILRYIKKIIDESHNVGIGVSMCGEMAGDPYYTPILLGFGLDEFSVSAAQIPKIKKVVRGISFSDVKKATEKMLRCGDRDEILKIMATIQVQQ
jgi:phosphotransferase system enzyme I (PtsI)